MKILVLGAGLVGGPMAVDLAKEKEYDVSIADKDQIRLNQLPADSGIHLIHQDLSNQEQLKELIKSFDMAVNAVPGFMGFQTLKTILEAGKNVVDITFFPEDLFSLDKLAKEKNVVAICDMGVAPGMSNVLSAYAASQMDQTRSIKIYVGGLPKTRTLPWEYKAVFSPTDVIEEYMRPARFVENGKLVTKPALTDPELLEFSKVGTLEAFNSDGLRSMLHTFNCPNMIEKTLRYPGHIDKIKLLKESGFFDEQEILLGNTSVKPIDLTTSILFSGWKLEKGESDITVMKIVVSGIKDGKSLNIQYDLYDEYDSQSGIHSMARTTGYTATMALRMLAAGLYTKTGVSAPEFVGKDPECVEFILDGLHQRGIHYRETRG